MEESEQKQVLTDLNNVVRSSSTCPFLVRFFGALFWEGDCWICMELMDVSLDKFYKFVFRVLRDRLPDFFLANIASSVRSTLVELFLCLLGFNAPLDRAFSIQLESISSFLTSVAIDFF